MNIASLIVCGVVSVATGGCSYKPLSAPCSMDEGGGPAQTARVEAVPAQAAAPAENTVQALSYTGVEAAPAFGPFASAREGDCGPLLPINAGTLR
jgi:hypothetical protein